MLFGWIEGNELGIYSELSPPLENSRELLWQWTSLLKSRKLLQYISYLITQQPVLIYEILVSVERNNT